MNRKGFALILVMLFTAITLTIVTSIASALASNVKLNRQAKNAYETFSLARGALDTGIAYLRGVNTSKDLNFPETPDCSADKYKVYFKQTTGELAGSYSFGNTNAMKIDAINYWANSQVNSGNDVKKDGFYAVRGCPVSGVDTITGIGFLQGQKLTLEGKVTHNDTYICDHLNTVLMTTDKCGTGSGVAHTCLVTDANVSNCLYNHKQDKIKVYQTRS